MGHKLQKFSRGGLPTPPAVGRGFAPPAAYLFVRNYIRNGEKGLKNASFGVINSKNFRGGVFRPPLHNPPTNLFVENYIKNGGKGLKNASFWVINSKNFRGGVFRPPLPSVGASPRPPQTCSSGKKNDLKKGGGEKMIESDNIYPCLDYLSLPLPFDLTFSQNSKYCSFTCFSVIFDL